MMKLERKSGIEYEFNLADSERDGSFRCPKCGTSISPDDDSEENYQILDTKVVNNELSELVISCGKCRSTIKLAVS